MIRKAPTIAFAALAAFLVIGGQAQAQTTTDEAREMASSALEQQRMRLAFVKPDPQAVAPGDYRAQAHNAAREANHRAMVEAVLAYGEGIRSRALEVNSEDSARAEASRVEREQRLGELSALLASSADLRRDVSEGTETHAQLAQR